MAGDAKATSWAAVKRGAVLAAGAFVVTFAQQMATVEDECGATEPPQTENCAPGSQSQEEQAFWAALVAGLGALGIRVGGEGLIDTARQASGSQTAADVQPNG
jgi:hypothetical protein